MKDAGCILPSDFENSRFNKENIKDSGTIIKKIFGHHLLLDLYDCDVSAIKSMDKCYHYLDVMPGLMDVQKQSQPFIVFKEGVGINGWVPIVESGVSAYTNIENGFASVDIYSCKEFDFDKVKTFTTEIFKPRKIHERYIFRGKDYVCPIL